MNPLQSTRVEVKCISKKQSGNYGNKEFPTQHAIEVEVPYNDGKNIYYKMSGGTNFVLNTVNDAAAAMFEIGKEYVIDIYPKSEPEPKAEDPGE